MSTIQNVRSRLANALGFGNNGSRDLWSVMGYPREVTIANLQAMYSRGGVANRIIRAYPQATWREVPKFRDDRGDGMDPDDKDSFSPFVKSVRDLLDTLHVFHYMERADRLGSIGQFGVLLLGFQDGTDLSAPLTPGKKPLLYLRAYGEPNCRVATWDRDPRSPRFGLPLTYNLQSGNTVGQSAAIRSLNVHHSRVMHFAELLDEDEVYATPRLLAPYNHLLDLEKVLGSSAETFYLNARGGLALSADKDAKFDLSVLEAMKQQAKDYEDQLTRTLAFQGITPTMLDTTIADPGPNVDKLLDVIAGATGIPKRILIGSERGELSSSQDENNWAARIDERQNNWATPSILHPFVDLMIRTGNVEPPEGEWFVEWPDSGALPVDRQAEIGKIRAEALASYTGAAGTETVVPIEEFRTAFLGLPAASPYVEPEEEVLDEEDPEVLAAMVPAGGDNVQATALNGAQIAALQSIAEGVGSGSMDPETAIQLILVGFPSVDEKTARSIISPMESFEAEKPEPPVMTPPPLPGVQPEDEVDGVQPEDEVKANRLRTAAVVTSNILRRIRTNKTVPALTLYIRRDVLNSDEIRSWYRAQGIELMTPAEEMHVTVAYSKRPVQWTKIGDSWHSGDSNGQIIVPPGGMRLMQSYGSDDRALVLLFTNNDLSWRWLSILESGASWSWGDYTPHVTISYDFDPKRVEDVEPFRGRIVLGPEVWEQVNEDWKKNLRENAGA